MITFVLLLALRQTTCLPEPLTARIVVRPDAVWFAGRRPVAVAFDRATREWRVAAPPAEVSAPAVNPDSALRCFDPGDTVRVAPGVRLVAQDAVTRGAVWHLQHDGSARAVPVKIADRYRPRSPRRSDPDDEAEPDSRASVTEFSPYVGSALHDGDLVWFGLFGGETNPGRYLGGLLRYSLRTRALTSLPADSLRFVAITGMAVAGGTLWMATQRIEFDEYEREQQPGVGLVQLGRSGTFTAYAAPGTPLPDNMVLGLVAVGDSLFVATETGVAVLDTRTMAWDRRFFRRVFGPTATTTVLAALDPDATETATDRAREAAAILMDELGIEDRQGFFAAATALDPEPLSQLVISYRYADARRAMSPLNGAYLEATEILQHASLLPYVRQALRSGSETWISSMVLRSLGDSAWARELAAALHTAPRPAAVAIAATLADSGLAAGLAWVRQQLRDRTVWADTVYDPRLERAPTLRGLLDIALEHPDRANLPALLDLVEATGNDFALLALWRIGDRAAKLAAAERIARHPRGHIAWLSQVTRYGPDSLLVRHDSAFRASAIAVSHQGLRLLATTPIDTSWATAPPSYDYITESPAYLRDLTAVPLLIPLLLRQWRVARLALSGLIRLTGAQPPPTEDPNRFGEHVDFWQRWWAANAATGQPLELRAGEAALERWRAAVLAARQQRAR